MEIVRFVHRGSYRTFVIYTFDMREEILIGEVVVFRYYSDSA